MAGSRAVIAQSRVPTAVKGTWSSELETLSNLSHWARACGAGDPLTANWKALGSYTVQPRAIRGIRIISLNSVFFSNKYHAASFANACSQVDSTAASRTFTWLESNLVLARQAGNQRGVGKRIEMEIRSNQKFPGGLTGKGLHTAGQKYQNHETSRQGRRSSHARC